MNDKLQQLYDLYKQKGIINTTDFNTFASASDDQRQKLYDLGVQKGLFNTTDYNTFNTAWGGQEPVKKKESTVSASKLEKPTSGSSSRRWDDVTEEPISQKKYRTDDYIDKVQNAQKKPKATNQNVESTFEQPKETKPPIKFEGLSEKEAMQMMAEDFGKKEFELYSKISDIDPNVFGKGKESTVDYLNNKFKGSGFVFEKGVTGESGNSIVIKSTLNDGLGTVVNEKVVQLPTERALSIGGFNEEEAKNAQKEISDFMNQAFLKKSEKEFLNEDVKDYGQLVKLAVTNPQKYGESFLNQYDTEKWIDKQYIGLVTEGKSIKREQQLLEQEIKAYQESGVFNEETERMIRGRAANLQNQVTANTKKYEEMKDITAKLPQAAAVYFQKKEKEGDLAGLVSGSFFGGLLNPSKMLITTAADVVPLLVPSEAMIPEVQQVRLKAAGMTDAQIKDYAAKQLRKGIVKEALQGVDNLVSAGTTQEYVQSGDRNDLEKVAGFLSESIGTAFSAGGNKALQSIAFFSQSYNAIEEEMNSPEFDGLTQMEKKLMSVPYGLVIGQLDKLGFNISKNVAKSPLFNKLVTNTIARAFTSVPKDASIDVMQKAIEESLTATMARAGLNIIGGSLVEGTTEGTQSLAEYTMKNIYNNVVADKDVFKNVPDITTKEGFDKALSAAGEEFYYGALGGAIMGTAGTAMESLTSGFNKGEKEFDFFEKVINDPNLRALIQTDIKTKITSGELTKAEAYEQIDAINKSVSILNSMPSDLPVESKREAYNLILERNKIEKQIEGKDPNLVAAQTERVKEINEQLKGLSYAVQEQGADAVSVQSGAGVSTEMAERTPATEPQVVTGETITEEVEVEVEGPKAEQPQAEVAQEEVVEKLTVNPSEGYSFEYESENDIPAELKGVEPTGRTETKVGRGKNAKTKLKLTFTGQQLIDAGLAATPEAQAEVVQETVQPTAQAQPTAKIETIEVQEVPQVEQTLDDLTQQNNVLTQNDFTAARIRNVGKEKVVAQIARAAKAIAKVLPKVKIVVHATPEAFVAATKDMDGRLSEGGLYDQQTGEIHINLERANNRTVAHEVFHALILSRVNTDLDAQKLTRSMIGAVRKSLKKAEGTAELISYLEDFESNYDENIKNEEKLAELFAILADNYKALPPASKNVIIRFLNRLAKALGLKEMTDREAIAFMNTLSRKVETGQEIEAREIGQQKEGKAAVRKQIIGEVGANKLDQQENSTLRMDNLKIAKDMKVAGETPKQIRSATGWEMGAEGKWRYETVDNLPFFNDVVNKVKSFRDQYINKYPLSVISDKAIVSKKASEIIPSELINMYPELNDYTIDFGVKDENKGSINVGKKTIRVDIGKNPINTVKVLLHEVQHAIQEIEGFDSGTNLEKILNQFIAQDNALKNRINKIRNTSPDSPLLDAVINQRKAFIDNFSTVNKNNEKILNAFDLYMRKAGEIEANNVINRMNMTEEERRNTLLTETESIKDRQIIEDRNTGKFAVRKQKTDVVKSKINEDWDHVITLNGKEIGKIFYDKSQKTWNNSDFYRGDVKPNTVQWVYGDVVGENKQEAIDEMVRRYKEKEAKTTPPTEEAKIKYTNDQVTNSFLNALNEKSDVSKNPIDNRSFIYGDKAFLEFSRFDKGDRNEIAIQSISTFDKGKGVGKQVMKDITDTADELGVTLTLDAKPFGNEGLSKEQLINFYKKNGFVADIEEMFGGEFESEEELIDYVVNEEPNVALQMTRKPSTRQFAVRKQKGLINLTDQEAVKYARAGVENKYDAQAIKQIGLQGTKFDKTSILDRIQKEFDGLVKNTTDYIFREDSPAIDQAIQNDIDTMVDQGYSNDQIERAKRALKPGPERDNFINSYRRAQVETANQWESYLGQSDYPASFKYLMLDAVLTNNYDLKTDRYQKRTAKTIRNFTPFDAGTLAELYMSDSNELLKDYVRIQADNSANIVESAAFSSTKDGKWIKFDGGGNVGEQELQDNANKLSQLVQNTYWCTKTNALSQLRDGDFYVYVTENKQGDFDPRIAVRMNGDKVGEVRGNASSKQDLEADMLPVADTFLREKIPNDSGKKWLDSIAYNTKVKDLTDKIDTKVLNMDDVNEYIDILKDKDKFSVDYGENGLVQILKNKFRNAKFSFGVADSQTDIKDDTLLLLAPNDIYTYMFRDNEQTKNVQVIIGNVNIYDDFDGGKVKAITGDVEFEDSSVKKIKSIESIGGGVRFRNSEIKDLGSLKSIGGDVSFIGSEVRYLGSLESIGGRAVFRDSEVRSLENLKYIGGKADFSESQVQDLGSLKEVGGTADFWDSPIESLDGLKKIGGDLILKDSEVKDLGELTEVGGTAKLENSRVRSLGKLKKVRNLFLNSTSNLNDLSELTEIVSNLNLYNNRSLKSLGNLKKIGGHAYFLDSKVEDLGNLESIGGDANFENSKVKDLGKLKEIKGTARFSESKIEDLGNLKKIGEHAYFKYSEVKSLGNLESIGGDAEFSNSEIEDLKNLKSIGENAYFYNSKVKDLGDLQFIGGVVGFQGKPELKEQWEQRQGRQFAVRKQKTTGPSRIVENGVKAGKTDAEIRQEGKAAGFTNKEMTEALSKYYTKEQGIFMKSGIKGKVGQFVDFAKRWKQKYLTTKGLLAKVGFTYKEKMEGEISAEANRAAKTAKKFGVMFDKFTGDKDLLKDAFDKALRGDKSIQLPAGFAGLANEMRNHIDRLSQMLIDSGAVDADMADTIRKNMGTYITRSYEIFDNKNFRQKIGEQELQAAKNFLRTQPGMIELAKSEAARTNVTVDEALDALVDNKIDEYFADAETGALVKGSKLGSKDLSTLKERKEIPEQIRMLMGEYSDPAMNYARTVLNIASLAARHQFLTQVKEAGMGKFFFEKNDSQRPKGFDTEIAAEGSDTMSPLNGLMTTPEIAEAFGLYNGQKGEDSWYSQLSRIYYKAMALIKHLKTIESVSTHMKNIFGNFGFVGVNGHSLIEIGKAAKVVAQDLKTMSKPEVEAKIDEYIKAGIMRQGAGINEIRDMFKDADMDGFLERRLSLRKPKKGVVGKIKQAISSRGSKIISLAEDLYQAEDDMFKIAAFETEMNRYADALYNKSKDQLTDKERQEVSDIAANNVKNTYPTYSRIPEGIKQLRKFPLFIGSFISFQAESYRTAYNTIALAKDELSSDNKKIKGIGARRVAGAGAYLTAKTALLSYAGYAAGTGLSGVLGALFNDDDEEKKEKDVRSFLPPWSKNSDLIILKAADGEIEYIDFSASDPHGGINKALNALFSGEDMLDSFKQSTLELVGQFQGPDILTNLAIQLKNNENDFGKQIYNEEDAFQEKTAKILDYVFKVVEPGTSTSIRKAAASEQSLGQLAFGEATGLKIRKSNIKEQFGYKLSEFDESFKDARKIYNSEYYKNERLLEDSKATNKDINEQQKKTDDAYVRANEKYAAKAKELMDLINSANRLGVDYDELIDQLESIKSTMGKSNIYEMEDGGTEFIKEK